MKIKNVYKKNKHTHKKNSHCTHTPKMLATHGMLASKKGKNK
jgi:hypothetical protein